MEVVYERCCGLDVHKRTVVACRIVPSPRAGWQREVRTFGTVTRDLLALADWLKAAGVTHVAMESTGVYWRPVYNREVEERLRPFEDEIQRLDTIPGVNRLIAEVLLAEVGMEPERFPTTGHLASWAGMCPGNDESAGKRRSGKTRKGSPWLRTALIEAAHGAARSKNTYLAAQFHRLVARRGKKKALVAVGHSILVIAYHVLLQKTSYHDLGPNYFDDRDRLHVQHRLTKRLERLGYRVTLEPLTAAA